MAVKLQGAIEEAFCDGGARLDEVAREKLDERLYDLVRCSTTYDADKLEDACGEYVDGSGPTVYDDQAYELCNERPGLADELACLVDEQAYTFHKLPLDRLPALAYHILVYDLRERISRHADELEELAGLQALAEGVGTDQWGLGALEVGDDVGAEVMGALDRAMEACDSTAFGNVLDCLADAVDGDGSLDVAAYRASL